MNGNRRRPLGLVKFTRPLLAPKSSGNGFLDSGQSLALFGNELGSMLAMRFGFSRRLRRDFAVGFNLLELARDMGLVRSVQFLDFGFCRRNTGVSFVPRNFGRIFGGSVRLRLGGQVSKPLLEIRAANLVRKL